MASDMIQSQMSERLHTGTTHNQNRNHNIMDIKRNSTFTHINVKDNVFITNVEILHDTHNTEYMKPRRSITTIQAPRAQVDKVPHTKGHKHTLTHTCTLRTSVIDDTCTACINPQQYVEKTTKYKQINERILSPIKSHTTQFEHRRTQSSRYMRTNTVHPANTLQYNDISEWFDANTCISPIKHVQSPQKSKFVSPNKVQRSTTVYKQSVQSPVRRTQTMKPTKLAALPVKPACVATQPNNHITQIVITPATPIHHTPPVTATQSSAVSRRASIDIPAVIHQSSVPKQPHTQHPQPSTTQLPIAKLTNQPFPLLVMPKPPQKIPSPNKPPVLSRVSTTESRLSHSGAAQLSSDSHIQSIIQSRRSSIDQLLNPQPTHAPVMQRVVSQSRQAISATDHLATRSIRSTYNIQVTSEPTSAAPQSRRPSVATKKHSIDDSLLGVKLHTANGQQQTASVRSRHNKLQPLMVDSVCHSSRPVTPAIHPNPLLQYDIKQLHHLPLHALNSLFTYYADRNDVIQHNSQRLRQFAMDCNDYIIALYRKTTQQAKPNLKPDAINKIVESEKPYILYGYKKKDPEHAVTTMLKHIILKLSLSKQKCISRVEFTTLFGAFVQQYIQPQKLATSMFCSIM